MFTRSVGDVEQFGGRKRRRFRRRKSRGELLKWNWLVENPSVWVIETDFRRNCCKFTTIYNNLQQFPVRDPIERSEGPGHLRFCFVFARQAMEHTSVWFGGTSHIAWPPYESNFDLCWNLQQFTTILEHMPVLEKYIFIPKTVRYVFWFYPWRSYSGSMEACDCTDFESFNFHGPWSNLQQFTTILQKWEGGGRIRRSVTKNFNNFV